MKSAISTTPVYSGTWQEWPIPSNEILEGLREALYSKRWTIRGWYTGVRSKQIEFAEKFASYNNAKYCTTVSSGSTALLVALEACDIGYGDEVIVPVLTWIATAIAVLNVNAIPVFADADITGCIDVDKIEQHITPKTKAIIVVHLHCGVAEMDKIMAIAEKHNLYVLEDCAQAHGAKYNNKRVGTIGHIGVFSMNQEKVLACGEGGAIITNDKLLYERSGRLRADGARYDSNRTLIKGQYELIDEGGLISSNYCMSDFQAAILLSELDKLEERNLRRLNNAIYLDKELSKIPGLLPLYHEKPGTQRTIFKYCIRIDRSVYQDIDIASMGKRLSFEIGFTIEQTECCPLHINPLYQPLTKKRHLLNNDYAGRIDVTGLSFPVAELLYDTVLIFHHRILLETVEKMDYIVSAFRKVLGH